MLTQRSIGPHLLLSPKEFEAVRSQKQKNILKLKKKRRVFVGPYAMFLFENAETLWWQIQEMVRIEKGGCAQMEDEIAAYHPLVPQGNEWCATLMFEIPDSQERAHLLKEWGHIEQCIYLSIYAGGQNHTITAQSIDDLERTTSDGKTSAVHFLKFSLVGIPILPPAIEGIAIGFNDPRYQYEAVLSPDMCDSLREDLKLCV